MTDDRDGLPRVQAHAVENLGMRGDFIVSRNGSVEGGIDVENSRHTSDAGENALLPGDDGRRRALVGIDAGVASGIARRAVFDECVFEDRGEAS